MTDSTRLWAVVPAAGIGSRMQQPLPKQYLKLGQRTILEHTLARLIETHLFHGIAVAIAHDDSWWAGSEFAEHQLLTTVEGGAERADSVLNALRALQDQADPQDWVLVHDAARPCVTRSEIQMLVAAVQDHPVGGILGLPMTDTVKSVQQGTIIGTQDRSQLWRALTPQMFRMGALLRALKQATGNITDEASAMEAMGLHPLMVRGSPRNIKITEPDDLVLAEIFLQT